MFRMDFLCLFLILTFTCLTIEDTIRFLGKNHASSIRLENCIPGDSFVTNYLIYECHFWGPMVKGYRINGCVPSNNAKGLVVHIAAAYKEPLFLYSCTRDENTVIYKATSCAYNMTGLAVGEVKKIGPKRLECKKEGDNLYIKETRVLHHLCKKHNVSECAGIGERRIFPKYGRGVEVAYNSYNRKLIV
uniref:RNAse_Pc domain-containing protein n=1 Tax=Rhabditophanes sp. KR3021 TaxID=114890 RepID=A0AC35UFH3_9BILA